MADATKNLAIEVKRKYLSRITSEIYFALSLNILAGFIYDLLKAAFLALCGALF